jgi:hypothetical protein
MEFHTGNTIPCQKMSEDLDKQDQAYFLVYRPCAAATCSNLEKRGLGGGDIHEEKSSVAVPQKIM